MSWSRKNSWVKHASGIFLLGPSNSLIFAPAFEFIETKKSNSETRSRQPLGSPGVLWVLTARRSQGRCHKLWLQRGHSRSLTLPAERQEDGSGPPDASLPVPLIRACRGPRGDRPSLWQGLSGGSESAVGAAGDHGVSSEPAPGRAPKSPKIYNWLEEWEIAQVRREGAAGWPWSRRASTVSSAPWAPGH